MGCTAIGDADLAARLKAMGPETMLTIAPDAEARYERFDQLLAVVRRAGVTRIGFEGNERMGLSAQ